MIPENKFDDAWRQLPSPSEAGFQVIYCEVVNNCVDFSNHFLYRFAVADNETDDSFGRASSSSQLATASPRKQFLQPLIYIVIWGALNFSVHV